MLEEVCRKDSQEKVVDFSLMQFCICLFLRLTILLVSAIDNCLFDRFEQIFQNLDSTRKAPSGDGKRLQFEFGDSESEMFELLQALHDLIFCVDTKPDTEPTKQRGRQGKRVPKTMREYNLDRKIIQQDGPSHRNRRCASISALKSTIGCSRQARHCDWEPGNDRLDVLSFFIPITHTTPLYVWPGSHVAVEQHQEKFRKSGKKGDWGSEFEGQTKILRERYGCANVQASEKLLVSPGECLIFVGHLLHAGAEWSEREPEENLRLHAYFLPANKRFPVNVTTVIPPPWILRAFDWPTTAADKQLADAEKAAAELEKKGNEGTYTVRPGLEKEVKGLREQVAALEEENGKLKHELELAEYARKALEKQLADAEKGAGKKRRR